MADKRNPLSHEQITKLLDEAAQASKEDRRAAAVELWAAYLRHNPDESSAWRQYGAVLRNIGLRHESERALLRAVEISNDDPMTHCQLGLLYTDMGHFERAEWAYERACSLSAPDTPGFVWILRGANLSETGQFETAAECYRMSLNCKEVELDEAWLNIGFLFRAKGEYVQARDAFQKAHTFDPNNEEIKLALHSLEGIDQAIALVQEIEGKHLDGSGKTE